MSRIGKMPIAIPAGVTVNIDDKEHTITVKGKLGELTQKYSDHVILEVEGDHIHVKPNEAVAEAGAKHGLYRALIFNMVKGVSEGFETVQEFVGVGYKAEAKGQILEMALGYSHTIFMEMPPEIKIETINERGKNPILKMRYTTNNFLVRWPQRFARCVSLNLIRVRVSSSKAKS